MDVMYFGDDSDSIELEVEFISEVKDKFKDVVLKDAYDQFKGNRQEVHLSEEDKEDYHIWLIAMGWFEMSLTLQLIMLDVDKREECLKLIELAKENYPNSFKK
jgi:hypothetical protein